MSNAMTNAIDRTVVRMKDYRPADVKARLTDSMGQLGERFAEGFETLSTGARTAARRTDGLVRANPWQAVGMVAAAGLLAGLAASAARRALRRRAADRVDLEAGG